MGDVSDMLIPAKVVSDSYAYIVYFLYRIKGCTLEVVLTVRYGMLLHVFVETYMVLHFDGAKPIIQVSAHTASQSISSCKNSLSTMELTFL